MSHANLKSEILDRTPPRDLDAERWVAGSIILRPTVFEDVRANCAAGDFIDIGCRAVFEAAERIGARGEAIDVGTVRLEMKAVGDFDEVRAEFLGALLQGVPTAAHAVHYARKVVDGAKRRAVIRAAERALRDAHDQTAAADDTAKRMENAAAAVQDRGRTVGITTIGDAAGVAMERFERIALTGAAPGLITGVRPIDEAVGGLHQGELSILAARPGAGKTSLALQIASTAARRGERVMFVSLEMGADELAARALCAAASVDSNAIRRGQMTPGDLNSLREATQAHQGLPLVLTDAPRSTVADIRAAAKQQARQGGLGLLVVDYLTRITPSDQRRPRHEQVGQLSADLKELAVELNVPLLCLAQLNRQGENTGTAGHV